MPQFLVDTDVLSDVLFADPIWEEWSSERMLTFAPDLAVNPMIYAELCCKTSSAAETDQILIDLGLDYLELPREALFLAAQAFQKYRERGGTRTAPIADFFIGAHAEASGLQIITRDPRRYATYFPTVGLIAP
jgi:predicted nucleic acid-binding protein